MLRGEQVQVVPVTATGPGLQERTNVGFDVVRGLAALLVVLGHSRANLSRLLHDSLLTHTWQRLLLAPTSFAQEAVAVFFVLSGYLVGGQVVRQVRRGSFSWRAYLAKRLSRFWTVLAPCLVLTLAVDALGAHLYPEAYRHLLAGKHGVAALMCNVALLQESHCASFGSNESLWSLSYEFWFYLAFAGAVVAWAAARRRSVRTLLAAALVVLTALSVFGLVLLLYIPAWLLGVVVAEVASRGGTERSGRSWSRGLALSVVLLALTLLVSNHFTVARLSRPGRLLLVGAGVVPLLLVLARAPERSDNRATRAVARLSTVSFSLYAYHIVLVKLLVAALTSWITLDQLGATLAVYLVAALATLLCLPLWFVTEHRTHAVRTMLLRLFGATRIPVGPAG